MPENLEELLAELRKGYEALGRRDPSILLEMADPEQLAVWDDPLLPEPRFEGYEELLRLDDDLANLRMTIQELIHDAPVSLQFDAEAEVLVVYRVKGKSKLLGNSVNARRFHVVSFNDRWRIIAVRAYVYAYAVFKALGIDDRAARELAETSGRPSA